MNLPHDHGARKSAVALVLRGHDDPDQARAVEVLVVWNRHYDGWTLPGGKVHHDEWPSAAMKRELQEETGLDTDRFLSNPFYVAESIDDGRRVPEGTDGTHRLVYCFRADVAPGSEPHQMEPGAPVGWMFIDEFLKASAFPSFHRAMLDAWNTRPTAPPKKTSK